MSEPRAPARPLTGKVAILTGVSRVGQVGEVVARVLAERGVAVVLIDRTGVEAEARATELRDRGLSARAYRGDLTDPGQLAGIAQSVATEYGGVDALVNIAGGFSMSGKVSDSDPEAWARQLGIGLTTAYLTTRAFLPLLRQVADSVSARPVELLLLLLPAALDGVSNRRTSHRGAVQEV